MKILDGKQIAQELRLELKNKIEKNKPVHPGLAAILIGENEASKTYVAIKEKACEEVGINFYKYEFSENISETEVINLISDLNNDAKIHGILVQLPLPAHLDTNKIIQAINPSKDADGFHPENVQLLKEDKTLVISPVYEAVSKLLDETSQNLSGKTALILANSEKFAQPLKDLLSSKNIKTEVLIKPESLNNISRGDIIISALGMPHFIVGAAIKKDAILIDVGFTRTNGKVMGDIDSESVSEKAAYLSPVPGGIGPLTVAYLLSNVIKLAKH